MQNMKKVSLAMPVHFGNHVQYSESKKTLICLHDYLLNFILDYHFIKSWEAIKTLYEHFHQKTLDVHCHQKTLAFDDTWKTLNIIRTGMFQLVP